MQPAPQFGVVQLKTVSMPAFTFGSSHAPKTNNPTPKFGAGITPVFGSAAPAFNVSSQLFEYIYSGDIENIRKKDISMSSCGTYSATAFLHAVQYGKYNIVQTFLNTPFTHDNLVSIRLHDALNTAINNVDEKMVDILLKAKAPVTSTLDRIKLPPLNAAIATNNEQIIKQLIAVSDINYYNDINDTALCAAIKQSNPNVVKMLIDAKADVNQPSKDTLPIILACQQRHSAIVGALMYAGVVVRDNFIQTLLDHDMPELIVNIAKYEQKNIDKCVFALPQYETSVGKLDYMVKQLIKAGAKIDVANAAGDTALILAVKNDNTNGVRVLIANGAKVSSNVIQYATSFNVAQVLMHANSDLSKASIELQKTILNGAMDCDDASIVYILLKHSDEHWAEMLRRVHCDTPYSIVLSIYRASKRNANAVYTQLLSVSNIDAAMTLFSDGVRSSDTSLANKVRDFIELHTQNIRHGRTTKLIVI